MPLLKTAYLNTCNKRIRFFIFVFFFHLLITLFICRLAFAHPMGADGDMFTYRIQPNDTLIDLASVYTLNEGNWKILQNINQIDDPTKLPIGKVLRIPFTLIPTKESYATLVHRQGQVFLNDEPINKGDLIKAGDTLRTNTHSFATILLEDDSSISLPENTELYFQQINQFVGIPIVDVIFELKNGSLETNVDPNDKGVGRYEIHTPVSVTGVRGTQMRINSAQQTSRTELIKGHAQVHTKSIKLHMLSSQQGAYVDDSGQLKVAHLPNAPKVISNEPSQGGRKIRIAPMNNAKAFLVQIATDPLGQRIISRNYTTENEFFLFPKQNGEHYAFIRAIDEQNFMGLDTLVQFPGRPILLTRDKQPVLSGFGQVIFVGSP